MASFEVALPIGHAYQRISAWLIELRWDVQRAKIPGAVRGYTSHADKLVRIADRLKATAATLTMVTTSASSQGAHRRVRVAGN